MRSVSNKFKHSSWGRWTGGEGVREAEVEGVGSRRNKGKLCNIGKILQLRKLKEVGTNKKKEGREPGLQGLGNRKFKAQDDL